MFIGVDMDREGIRTALNDCILTEEEMTQDWSLFPDPLPAWPTA
ncbi:hypothetical protein [Paenibacillus soyae]